jgi:squalene-hopene/tetraprenyl-beta-curcumene cyclase
MLRKLLRSTAVGTSFLALMALLLFQARTEAASLPAKDAEEEKQWNETVDKAIAFLRKSQAEDGSFSKNLSVGVTGVVVTGLLGTGKVDVNDPM